MRGPIRNGRRPRPFRRRSGCGASGEEPLTAVAMRLAAASRWKLGSGLTIDLLRSKAGGLSSEGSLADKGIKKMELDMAEKLSAFLLM